MLFEVVGIKRLAYLLDCNNQQFVDEPRLVKLFGMEGPQAWRMVGPDEIVGEFDYRPAGANIDPAANKEVRRQQLNELMGIVLQTGNPYIEKYELTKMWLESYDIRNVDKLLIDKQQVLAQMMAAQAQQAQMAQGPDMPITPPMPGADMGPGEPITPI